MAFATQEKVAELATAFGDEIEDTKHDIKELNTGLVETVKSLGDLQGQIKLIRHGGMNRPLSEDKTRVWPSDEMAKSFMKEVFIPAVRGKALTETGEGGVAVPAEMTPYIIQRQNEYGVIRQEVNRIPMGSSSIEIPIETDDYPVTCPGEGGEIDEGNMGLRLITITPKKLACHGVVSSEFEEDAIVSVAELAGRNMARSLAKAEDLIGFLGDGTSTYYGMQGICGALRAVDATIGNIKSLVVGSGNVYSELTLADFRKVCGQLPASAEANAKWYVSKNFFWNVMLALMWAETTGNPTIGTPEFFQQGPTKYYLGYPVVYTQAMPKAQANSQICALLADLRLGALLGERRTLNLARSEHVYFKSDKIAFRATERIAVNAFGVGDTTDAGPICGLITAAS
jgi:HK97 family phage major capsid protein